MISRAMRRIIGAPLPTDEAQHQRIGKLTALAVFSSDALSSVAYATQEIFLTMSIAGAAAFSLSLPVSIAICGLLVILTASYRQTIFAYPTGGGAYIVAKDNLGTWPGLVAGAALLVDYVLTVSVSIASGVQAVTSAVDFLKPHTVALCLVALAAVTVANLRGVKESGRLFSVPTYFFVVMLLATILWGVARMPHAVADAARATLHPVVPVGVGWFLVLHGFASGCAALTGVEAISNGVPAFKEPSSRNAAKTMLAMALLLGSMFLGVSILAHAYGAQYGSLDYWLARTGNLEAARHAFDAQDSVLSQVSHAVFGGGPLFYTMQAATALILLLAANTSFADFPRLGSLLAVDRFMPRQFAMRGDRLVFSNGILILAVLAGVLIVVFGGNTDALVPLYAVGVFVSFTLSQAGMVLHWLHPKGGTKAKGFWWRAAMNGAGAIVTLAVLVVIAATKFLDGAWLVVILIPILVLFMKTIERAYLQTGRQLRVGDGDMLPPPRHHTVVVPVPGVHKGVLYAVGYARSISTDVRAVYVELDPDKTPYVKENWNKHCPGVPLIVVPSPYRSLAGPLLAYIDQVEDERDDDIVTIILPEFVPRRWWQHILHNQSALLLKAALLFKRNKVVTSCPYHLDE